MSTEKDPSTLAREGFIAGAKNGYNRGFREGMDKRKERDLALCRAAYQEGYDHASRGTAPRTLTELIRQVDASLAAQVSLGGEAVDATVTPSHYAEGIEAEPASRSGGLESVPAAEPPSENHWQHGYWDGKREEQQRAAEVMGCLLPKDAATLDAMIEIWPEYATARGHALAYIAEAAARDEKAAHFDWQAGYRACADNCAAEHIDRATVREMLVRALCGRVSKGLADAEAIADRILAEAKP